MVSGARFQGRLFRKYVVIFFFLIGGALLTSGLVQLSFAYQDNQAAVVSLQRGTALATASQIEQVIRESERQIGWVELVGSAAGTVSPDERRSDYLKLLRQAPSVSAVSYLDPAGRQQLRVTRPGLEAAGDQPGESRETIFREAKAGGISFGPVYLRNGSEPTMTIALAEGSEDGGVTVAEVDLKPVWEIVSQIKIGQSGYGYIVDDRGRVIAHPDRSLVLQQTDVSSSPQFQAARSGTLQGRQEVGGQEAVDPLGPSVLVVSQIDRQRYFGDAGASSDRLVAYQSIDPPGWTLFVDQSLEEAFGPVRAVVGRTALLLLMGLVIAVLASMLVVRRMLAPIEALQAGAARIGEGALDQRIEVRTGDEHEALAEQFNVMAEHLRESYATLEQKVEDRTRDLAAALEQRDRLLREVEETSRQLAEVSRHKSEFLANMSHELRTPLNAIIGFSEVLLERMFGDLNDRQEEYLRDILTSGQHLLSLINDILDLSKVEAGQMELELSEFSIREALEQGVTMLKERAGRHGISLSVEVGPELGTIEADQRKVKQVVFNLLSNAVKFTPDGGRIDVTACQMDHEVRVAVRDTGIGIAPEDQGRIFEEFRQVGPGTAKAEGTGLGLALTKKLVELHGGRIWVESAPGQGSTFTFALPLRAAGVRSAAP